MMGKCQNRNCLCASCLQVVVSCLHAASTSAQQAKDKSALFDTIEMVFSMAKIQSCAMVSC